MGAQLEQRMVATVRDCPARLVPSGQSVTIPAHQFVTITQARGGNYTVSYKGNLARIDGIDAEALGLVREEIPLPDDDTDEALEETVWKVLATVYDPEIPVNIVALGLIYGVGIQQENDAGDATATIDMTLTAPACGMGQVLANDVKYRVGKIPQVKQVEVKMVFDPPWCREMISDEAKLELGIF